MSGEYDPYNVRAPKTAKTTVSLQDGDGNVILPPTDIETVKAGLAEIKRRQPPAKARKAAARKATEAAKPDDGAMFSEAETGEAVVNSIAAAELRQIVERIERLNEEKQTLAEDTKEVFAEAKGRGYNTKAIRTIIRLRKQDPADRQEEEAILDLYKHALGMA